MDHPPIDQIVYDRGERIAYRCGDKWYNLDWTEDTHKTAPNGRHRLGSGECGVVWREGDEAVKGTHAKGRKTTEGEAYNLLRFIEGIANGRQVGDEIRTPVFANVISRYTIKEPQRLLFGPLIRMNLPRITNAIDALTQAGYDYGDVLQFGVDDKAEFHLLDFSATKHSENAAEANQSRLSEFLEDFSA